MRDIRILTADAGASIAALVAGPPRRARVLAAFPNAVYLAPDQGRVVGIEASDGVGLPNALRLRAPSGGLGLDTIPEDARAEVGGSRIVVGDLEVAVDRWVDHAHRPDTVDTAVLRDRLDQLDAELAAADALEEPLDARVGQLELALAELDLDAMLTAGRALVGLGGGLTPSGDDILCGLLSMGRTLARPLGDAELDRVLQRLGGELQADAGERTTALSAALLWHATRAEMARPARGLLRAMLGETPLQPAAKALLVVGHSSGRDLAIGMSLGAAAVLARTDHHTDHRTEGAAR